LLPPAPERDTTLRVAPIAKPAIVAEGRHG
jgi:hypothetical protein